MVGHTRLVMVEGQKVVRLCICLKVKLTGFANGWNVRYDRNTGTKDDVKVFDSSSVKDGDSYVVGVYFMAGQSYTSGRQQ